VSFAKIMTTLRGVADDLLEHNDVTKMTPGITGRSPAWARSADTADRPHATRSVDSARQAARRSSQGGDVFVRKMRHVCDGGRRGRRRSRETVRSDTSTPTLPNSPWIRGAPQSGFTVAIRLTSVRMAASVLGRP
jgi:hypothetical protein